MDAIQAASKLSYDIRNVDLAWLRKFKLNRIEIHCPGDQEHHITPEDEIIFIAFEHTLNYLWPVIKWFAVRKAKRIYKKRYGGTIEILKEVNKIYEVT